MKKRLWTADLLIIGALGLATLLFFWKVVFLGEVFYFRDTFKFFYPLKKYLVTTLSQGRLPLWNPYMYNGVPFLADNTTAVFYPFHILYLFLPFDMAFQYFILLHYFLGGVFVYLLMRGWKLSRYASTFAALAFMFNTYLVQMSGNLIYLAIIWTPLFFWALHRALVAKKLRAGILPGIILSIQFLAGEPQSVYWNLILGFVYLLSQEPWWQKKPLPALRYTWLFPFRLFLIISLTALGLSMIQLLPSLEMAMLSDRQGGLPYEIAILWSYHPLRLLEFFIPFFFGDPTSPEQYWGFFLQNYIDGGSSWTVAVYSGFLPLLFALVALCNGTQRKLILFISALGGTALLLAFGLYTPLYHLFYEYLPLFDLFRYPEKYMSLVTLSIPLLAGFGMDRLFGHRSLADREKDEVQETRSGSWIVRGLGLFSTLLVVGYGVLSWKEEIFAEMIQQAMHGYHNPFLQPSAILVQIRFSLLFVCSIAIGSAITFLGWQRKILGEQSVKTLFMAILLFDLFWVSSRVNYTSFAELYDPLPADTTILQILQIKESSPFRVHRDKLYFYDRPDDNSPLSLYERRKLWEKYTLVENIGMNYGVQYLHGYTGHHLRRYFDLQQYHLFPLLFDLFNTRYFLVHHKEKIFTDPLHYKTIAIAPWNGLRVVENLRVFPRAFWVPRAVVLSKPEEIIQRLADPQFNPRREVLLEEPVKQDDQPSRLEEAQVTILSYAPERVRLQVQSPTQGFVVLGDTYYPGWKVFIDGQPSPLLRANYVLRAVQVEGGTHQIDFIYDPWTFKIGALVSGITGLVLGGVCWPWRRRMDHSALCSGQG